MLFLDNVDEREQHANAMYATNKSDGVIWKFPREISINGSAKFSWMVALLFVFDIARPRPHCN